MKVFILYHSGALPNALAIYRALAERPNIELTVAVPETVACDRVYHPSGRLEIKQKSDSNGYRLLSLPLVDPSRYNLGFETDPLRRSIRESRADILHVWDEPFSYGLFQVTWLRLLASLKSKVLFYGFENTPVKGGVLGKILWRTTWPQVAGGAAANSEALAHLRQAGFPKNHPTERIFWGISTDTFQPMDKIGLRRDLKLDCEHIVGYIGRLVPEKGLAWLLAAVKQLPANVHCLIIGNGPMRAEIELWSELPSLAGRVHLMDAKSVEEIPRYLNCMDVLALPSLTTRRWKEQYGRIMVEAMACGVPVVASDSGAIPEVAGTAGLIVREGDVTALVDGLQRATFSEIRPRLIQNGYERVQKELSAEAMSQKLSDFYGRIIGN